MGINDIVFSLDGRFMAVVENGFYPSSVGILRAQSPNLPYRKLDFGGIIADIEFSPDSHILAVLLNGGSSGGTLYLYRAEDGRSEGSFEYEIHGSSSIDFHPNGDLLSIAQRTGDHHVGIQNTLNFECTAYKWLRHFIFYGCQLHSFNNK